MDKGTTNSLFCNTFFKKLFFSKYLRRTALALQHLHRNTPHHNTSHHNATITSLAGTAGNQSGNLNEAAYFLALSREKIFCPTSLFS